MSNKKLHMPLSPAEIKKLAKKIISENPIYMPDEPATVGSPENLTEKQKEAEKEFILFFSKKMDNQSIPSLLEKSAPITQEEAEIISVFFWKIIDLAVDLQNSEECPWPEGYEFWSEKVLQSIAAFLKSSGYENILNEASKSKN